jgi:PPOX class probable F420-dependent enzyme
MDDETRQSRLEAARVARLATVDAEGRPHVVPCCFAMAGGTIVTAVDAKPKSTLRLRRLDNVRVNPLAGVLVDHYDDDDWSALWWIRVDGRASVVEDGTTRDQALAALAAKYRQYRDTPPPGPVMLIEPTRWRSWP